jgi:hypothetical protein
MQQVEPGAACIGKIALERGRHFGELGRAPIKRRHRFPGEPAQYAMAVARLDLAAHVKDDFALGPDLVDQMRRIAKTVGKPPGIADPRSLDAPAFHRLRRPAPRRQQQVKNSLPRPRRRGETQPVIDGNPHGRQAQ